jgi:hypothetical protein
MELESAGTIEKPIRGLWIRRMQNGVEYVPG